ncbi:MAG: DapH/DapD/GlmU-related protein [Pseudomonadota bacterium]
MERTTSISLSSRLVAGRRNDITIGPETLIAFKTLVYSRDPVSGEHRPVRIGRHCFVGGGSTILPGVTIGDGSIVGAGSVVFDDVPPRSIVAGNPARVLQADVELGPYGRLKSADDSIRKMWR